MKYYPEMSYLFEFSSTPCIGAFLEEAVFGEGVKWASDFCTCFHELKPPQDYLF